jgi:hypothetical protein
MLFLLLLENIAQGAIFFGPVSGPTRCNIQAQQNQKFNEEAKNTNFSFIPIFLLSLFYFPFCSQLT